MKPGKRIGLLVAFLAGILFLCGRQAPIAESTFFAPRDFGAYISATLLLLDGQDPYDATALRQVQRVLTGDAALAEATIPWSAPYTFALYIPFAAIPARWSHLLWIGLQAGSVFWSTRELWKLYGGSSGPHRPFGADPLFLTGAFGPTIWLLVYGQITGLVLLGVTGFLRGMSENRPMRAGVFLSLTALKPHLLLLFGFAVALRLATRSGFRAIGTGIGCITVACIVVCTLKPDVFTEYQTALARPSGEAARSISTWPQPLLSYHLRLMVNAERYTIQFVPILLAAGLLLLLQGVRRRPLDWAESLPMLVFGSLLFAPYGAWVFDLVLLLVPIVARLAPLTATPKRFRLAFGSLLLISLSSITINEFSEGLFFTPLVLFWYLLFAPPRSVFSATAGA